MPLHHYLQVLRKRWITLVVVTLLCVVAAGVITALTPATYAATATSFVSLTDAGGASTSLAQNSQFAQSRVESYPEVVHSPKVLDPVIRDLGLDMTAQELSHKVTAVNPTSTVNLQVTATDHSPQVAADIANGVATNMATVIEELETPRNGGAAPVKVTVTAPANVPHHPISPRRTLNLALGLVLGLALGAVGALIREARDTTVRSGSELYDLTGLSPLGSVRFDSAFRTNPLVAMHTRGFGVEDFRTIRTTLQFVNVDSPPQQIVVSSAIAAEGKSFTAVNLAITMAQADLSVCLVEGDLRRPRATGYLGIDGSLGLSDVVAGHYALDDALVEWNRGQITVLPAGTTPPDPGQLLGSHAMEEVLAELRNRFDRVIIDAPPLLPVSDAVVLGGISDGVIVVARYRHVRREQFVMAVENLRAANATVLGTILTQVPSKLHSARYGDDYDYAHPPSRIADVEAPATAVPSERRVRRPWDDTAEGLRTGAGPAAQAADPGGRPHRAAPRDHPDQERRQRAPQGRSRATGCQGSGRGSSEHVGHPGHQLVHDAGQLWHDPAMRSARRLHVRVGHVDVEDGDALGPEPVALSSLGQQGDLSAGRVHLVDQPLQLLPGVVRVVERMDVEPRLGGNPASRYADGLDHPLRQSGRLTHGEEPAPHRGLEPHHLRARLAVGGDHHGRLADPRPRQRVRAVPVHHGTSLRIRLHVLARLRAPAPALHGAGAGADDRDPAGQPLRPQPVQREGLRTR